MAIDDEEDNFDIAITIPGSRAIDSPVSSKTGAQLSRNPNLQNSPMFEPFSTAMAPVSSSDIHIE